MPKQIIYIAAGLLLLGAMPLPYGYYTLLRIVACGAFAWATFAAFERNERVLPWVYGILAVIFNPVIKIHFPKELWAIIDVCSALLLIFTSSKIAEQRLERQ